MANLLHDLHRPNNLNANFKNVSDTVIKQSIYIFFYCVYIYIYIIFFNLQSPKMHRAVALKEPLGVCSRY